MSSRFVDSIEQIEMKLINVISALYNLRKYDEHGNYILSIPQDAQEPIQKKLRSIEIALTQSLNDLKMVRSTSENKLLFKSIIENNEEI